MVRFLGFRCTFHGYLTLCLTSFPWDIQYFESTKNITGEIKAAGDLVAFAQADSSHSASQSSISNKFVQSPTMDHHFNPLLPRHEPENLKYEPPKLDECSGAEMSSIKSSNSEKKFAFGWVTSKAKREKEAVNLDFQRTLNRLPSQLDTFESSISKFQSCYSRVQFFPCSSHSHSRKYGFRLTIHSNIILTI